MKKTIIWLITVTIVTSMVFLGISCKEPEVVVETVTETVTETVEVEKEGKLSVYLFEPGLWHPFFWAHIHGAQDAAVKYDNLDLVVLDGRNDPVFQATQVIQSIAKGLDGIILNAVTSDALIPAAKAATEAGIPVFTSDRDIGDPQYRIGSVKGNQYIMGTVAAENAIAFLEEKGVTKPWRVVLLEGLAGHEPSQEQAQGWKDVLDPYVQKGDAEIVEDVATEWAKEIALTKMQQILVKTHDIDLIICGNDQVAAGAILAMEAANLTAGEDIYLTGQDLDTDGIQMIKDGKLLGSSVHNARLLGYWSVEMMMAYLLEGKTPPEEFENGTIALESVFVDKSNVDDFQPFGDLVATEPGQPAAPLPY